MAHLQMAEGNLKAASTPKLAGDLVTEAEVNIEDFRGDSATDDISRQAVMKSLVDIEQTGATQHMLCCTMSRSLPPGIAEHAIECIPWCRFVHACCCSFASA